MLADIHGVDPTQFKANLEDLHSLEIEREEDVVKLVVAVISQDPFQTTVNLKAPIIINHKRMTGKQIVLSTSDYHTHQPLVLGTPG